ncbi:hypothetical protein Y032_0209g2116 [Ancylostoma ceylanicum]|uniref:Uncharacterized protein n=1 Tax=Ancylostoma ceylanicum TaxID=53326 RepID=A0A016SKQ7_9BILA|nr:hypothetical protein Y032_0209g2116 [Ancylostoma ceylanicum]
MCTAQQLYKESDALLGTYLSIFPRMLFSYTVPQYTVNNQSVTAILERNFYNGFSEVLKMEAYIVMSASVKVLVSF